jgi:hypothetical protein
MDRKEKIIIKDALFLYFGFPYVAKNTKSWLENCIS